MLKAFEMLALQKRSMKSYLEDEMKNAAQNGNSNYIASYEECPKWLVTELLSDGYKIKDSGHDLKIIWGE